VLPEPLRGPGSARLTSALGVTSMNPNPSQPEYFIFAWMLWADQHGVWGITGTVLLPALGFTVFFWAKRRVRNLNFFLQRVRDGSNYPLRVHVEIRNYTGRSVVISAPYFVYGDLRPDPNARGDSPSREYEIKFPDLQSKLLSEVEYLLRHRESVLTWVPIDPTHTDKEVDTAIEKHSVGELRCMCTWLQDKPKVHKLVRRL
jgi:hypothetical protein